MVGTPSRFSAYDILRRDEIWIDSTVTRLKRQDLERAVYSPIEEAIRTNRNNIHLVLKQMITSFDEARTHKKIDRALWMSLRLQRAMEHRKCMQDTECLTKSEALNTFVRIHQFHEDNRDAPEAANVRRHLLHSGLTGSVSPKEITELFATSIESFSHFNSIQASQRGETRSPLHELAELGHVALFPNFQRVAAGGICPETDFIGRTLLHVAAEGGHAELVKYLLSLEESYENFKLGIDRRDEAGRTAIFLAISNGQEATYRVLRRLGACLKIRDKAGHTPLVMAARMNQVSLSQCVFAAFVVELQRIL